MRCAECGTDNPTHSANCVNCGAGLAAHCAQCDHYNSLAAQFCSSCGAPLDQADDSIRAAPRQRSPVVAERKQATVLFAAFTDPTGFMADLDPEETMAQLMPAVEAMSDTVRRFDGTIVRALAGGVMALFGAPRAQEGHALLACKAALAMQDAMALHASAPPIRVGLHSGEVVTGALDLSPAGQPDAQGLTVNVASHIEQMAAPGEIRLTMDCYRLVRSYCDVRPLGLQAVKGVRDQLEVFQLLGLKPAVASEQFRAVALTEFRGRDDDLAALQRALERTEQGDARVIGVSAPPGIGKSRLCFEFAEWCRRRLVPVAEARALTYGHATPFQPLLEILRAFFRITPTTEPAAARRAIAHVLLRFDSGFAGDLPLLEDFLGVADPEHPAPRLDPSVRRSRLLDVLRRIVRASGRRTGVIIVEDLHWLDEASSDFIGMLVDAVVGTHTMVVLNFRPSYAAPWMKRPHYEELVLAELSPVQIRALVRQRIGDHPRLSEIRERVAQQSDGNPFFAEELIHSLAESGVLEGTLGDYRPGVSRQGATLPATVQAVIGARIDRLADREKAVLQIGSVVGKEFPLAVVQQVGDMPAAETERLLGRLCEAGLIQEQAGIDRRRFAFRHPLIQEVAYSMQLKTRRGALHAAVVNAMEQYYGGRLDEFAGLLAHHCEAAGQFVGAVAYLQRAAMWLGKTDSSQALKHWRKLRALLQDQPHSEANDRLRALASGQILNFGWREGMIAEEAKPFADEALRWARATGDRTHEVLLIGGYGRIMAQSGPADSYVGLTKEALALMSREEDAGPRATVNGMLSQAYCFAGRLREALAANNAALQDITRQSDVAGLVVPGFNVRQVMGFNVERWIKYLRLRILVLLGRFDEAEAGLNQVFAAEPEQLEPVVDFIPHLASVELAWNRGNAAAAERHARRVIEIADQSAIPYLRTCGFCCAGAAKTTAGDFSGAIRELSRGIEFARGAKAGLEYEARMLAELADAHYRAGDARQAAATAEEAIEIARRRTARIAECHASLVRAAALLELGDPAHRAEAAELFRRAEQLLDESGAAILEPLPARQRVRLAFGVT